MSGKISRCSLTSSVWHSARNFRTFSPSIGPRGMYVISNRRFELRSTLSSLPHLTYSASQSSSAFLMLCHSRGFGSKVGLDGFTDVRYNTAADNFLEQVECVLEELNHESIEEIQNGGGVLTIDITHCGSFVLNKQAPNLQLWLSSPLSGPHHYNMVEEEEAPRTATASHSANWLCEKDQHSLKEKLESELSQALGKQIKF